MNANESTKWSISVTRARNRQPKLPRAIDVTTLSLDHAAAEHQSGCPPSDGRSARAVGLERTSAMAFLWTRPNQVTGPLRAPGGLAAPSGGRFSSGWLRWLC